MSQEAKTSCDGCAHYLGGGLCAINVEGECREGGGYELYDWQEKAQSKQGSTYDSERHIFLLLQLERKAHAETRRLLEKADHDRKRYARRIRFLDYRHGIMCCEYHAAQAEIHVLKTAVTALEGRLKAYEQGTEKGAAENGAPAEEAATGVHEVE